MSQRVGFDREIRLEWLDKTVELVIEGQTKNETERALKAYLEQTLTKEASRKTMLVLRNMWLQVPDELVSIRDEGLILYKNISKQDRIWLHWGMSLLSYQFFKDIVEIIGNLLTIQDDFTTEQIRNRFIEKWGSRTTTGRAINRVLLSMLLWDVLSRTPAGKLTLSKKRNTENIDLQTWAVICTIYASRKAIPVIDLLNSSLLFPFRLTISGNDLRRIAKLDIVREGSGIDYALLKRDH